MTDSKLRFVIIEKDSFIAHDMQSGLQAAVPDCDTRWLPNVSDVVAQLSSAAADARTVLITKLSLSQLEETGLSNLAQQRGAEIVVRLGEDPKEEITRRGWFSLESPFTWDDLADLVGALSSRSVTM
jgi:hypothetical protein